MGSSPTRFSADAHYILPSKKKESKKKIPSGQPLIADAQYIPPSKKRGSMRENSVGLPTNRLSDKMDPISYGLT